MKPTNEELRKEIEENEWRIILPLTCVWAILELMVILFG